MFLRLAPVFLFAASALHAKSLALAGLSLGSTVGATYYWNRNDVITSSADFNKSYNWTANANGTGARPATSQDDAFTDNTLGAAWTFRDYDNASGGAASLTTNTDQLTLTGQGDNLWDVSNEFVAIQRNDITGSFDVTVKVNSVSNFHSNDGKAGLLMADDITTLGSGGYANVFVKSGATAHFEYDVASTAGTIDGAAASGTLSFPIWLRMVKNGTAVSAFYRTSLSNAWTQIGSAQTPLSTATNSHVSIFMLSGTSGTTGTAVFDDFHAGTDMSVTGDALSFAGTGAGNFGPDANATLTASQAAASIDFTGYTGTFNLGSYSLTLNTGNATFVSGMTLTAGTGTLAFTATSGTQVLTPKSGATHPHIIHSGAGTLQLATNALTCLSFSQSAGTFDFNGMDVTTASSGDFTLTNGTSTSLANLNGRTLTVAGNASFTGQSGNLLNLNPASWILTVTGTLTASYATLAGSNASGGTAGRASNSTDGGGNSNWTFSDQTSKFSRSTRFTFNTTASGANVSGNVSNVPILLRLTAANVDFSATSAAGTDIQVVDKGGSVLYHEVVEWDKANQTGKVWVKVPQVDGNSTADFITFYYGCPSCTSNPYARGDSVFTGFKSVFHLNTPENKAYDAALAANHGTYYKNVANATGLVTRTSAVFDGVSDYVELPTETNYDILTNLSVWAWVRVDALDKATQAIVTKGNTSWRLTRSASTNFVEFSGTKGSTAFTSTGDDNITATGSSSGWHHVVGTYDGSSIKLYVDGAQDGSSTTVTGGGSLDNTSHAVYLGEDAQTTGRQWRGRISEVRIGNTSGALSADFIKLSYENQKESSTLFSSATLTTASFRKSKRFTFNTTASGANVSGNVADFPLLLRVTGNTVVDSVEDGAPDIRFLDGDGVTWLDYQVERWDKTLDSAEVWVKVPQVDGNSSADFVTMYYQQASGVTVPDGQCASCVFSTANRVAGAWHLDEETAGTGTASVYRDATGNGYHGTDQIAATTREGVIGRGHDFIPNDRIDLVASSSLIPSSTTPLTYSAWFKADAISSNAAVAHRILGVHRDAGSSSAVSWGLGNTNKVAFYSNGITVTQYSTGTVSAGAWTHGALTWDGSQFRIYINGNLDAGSPIAGTSWAGSTGLGRIGAADGTTLGFDGHLDEVRLEHAARSADWIKLSYQNQRRDAAPLFIPNPADFSGTQKYRFNTTKTGANVMGDVENFPVLVRIAGSAIVDAVQDNAPDIRFLDGDGVTWLPYQVERWSKAADSAEVWVKVPKVSGNSDQDFITLYYNDVTNGSVTDGQCGSCVFEASNGFRGVWHLHQSLATMTDATGANNGTTQNSPTRAGTVIDTGLTFNGSSQYVSTAVSYSNPSTFTVSAWFKTNTSNGGLIMGFGSSVTGASTSYDRNIYMSNAGKLLFGVNPSTQAICSTSSTYNDNSWHHVVGRLSSNGQRIYVDGVEAMSKVGTTSAQNFTGYWRLGYDNIQWWTSAPSSYFFAGSIDEAVYSDAERSADWIKLAYESQRHTGNVFWNARPGPNNKTTLTAADAGGSITLSWTTPVSDSSNADSVGLWVKYASTLDSVGATGQTRVVFLPKTDSTYSYPATYSGTYYFGLAVRNSSGLWSPFTAASIDTLSYTYSTSLTDTIYVDSSLGTATGNTAASCTNARNPATPLKEIEDAVWCAQASGFLPNDTLVVRVMPGIYSTASDNELAAPSTYPVVVTSFDGDSRAVLSSATSPLYTVSLGNLATLRRMDVRAATNAAAGILYTSNADSVVVDGCRIYNNGNVKHDTGIVIPAGTNEGILITNTLVHEPTRYGVYVLSDDRTNIINNTFVGTGAAGTRGIYMPRDAWSTGFQTFTNNLFYNWDYGFSTTDADSEVGFVSNNMFHLVTSGREVDRETDAAKVVKDPLFYSSTLGNRHAFKPLPGSPALDAGTATINTSGAEAWPRVSNADHYGTSRPQGSARDIGAYEGTGYTPSPTGDFDSLTNTVSGNTVIVKNSKWKLVWDKAVGGGIAGFYDMTGDTTLNLVGSGSLLFDLRVDAFTASGATGNNIAPYFQESTRARSQVRQRLAVSASLDVNLTYTVYPSGHVFIQSELDNLTAGTLDLDVVQYSLKLGSASAVTQSASNLAGISFKNGYGYLATSTKDPLLSVTQDLDGAGAFSETWSQVGSVAGSVDSVGFSTADLADPARNMKRHHHFLLYVGDNGLDGTKAATLNADAWSPSVVSASSGSLLHERSWQDKLGGHWTLDDGAGAAARDKSVLYANNAALTSTSWVSGQVGGALRFTTSSVGTVADQDALEVRLGFSVAFWMKPDFSAMGGTAYVLSKGTGSSDGWNFQKNTGANTFRFRVDGATADSPVLTTGTWYHVVGNVTGTGRVQLFVNGVLAGAATATPAIAANSSALRIGENAASGSGDRYAGDLDDIRLYHRELTVAEIQAMYSRGFSAQAGHYHLRADNNNRLVALLNESAAATRVQPAFRIDNWFGIRTPRYVYLNGIRLQPNVDFVSDTVRNAGAGWDFGACLYLQVNKTLTGSSQTLFVDDDDSSGYLGESAKMKTLAMSATANDKITLQNFSGTTFGSASSGQWYLELDLNGWTNPNQNRLVDSGFGGFNVWKAAAISPNVALSSATQLVGLHAEAGRSLMTGKIQNILNPNNIFMSGRGYAGPANISYSLVDSSAARLSLTLDTMTLSSNEGTVKLVKRYTIYPTGRIIASFHIASSNFNFDLPRLDVYTRYNSSPTIAWSNATAAATARTGYYGGDAAYHSTVAGLLSIKSAGASVMAPASTVGSVTQTSNNASGADVRGAVINMPTGLFESTDDPITVNWALDISRDFTDSATADSLMKDLQTPATMTALTGTVDSSDALDFKADGFAEGDGAYTYNASGGGIAHFKFVNTVAHFSPAFRIKSWSFGTLPEFVLVDNQTLTRDYHYNAYLNTATNELILQMNRTFAPGNHVFYIAHKTGLAVTLNRFAAVSGDGVDTLAWTTQSEFENLGFHVWRRASRDQDAEPRAAESADSADTLASQAHSPEELLAMGYARLTAKLLPGAPGGASATTREYAFIDRTAAQGVTYDYLLEAVDFSGAVVHYGPRTARPGIPLETTLYTNYPNPFNPITTLRFSLREKAKVSLVIYDVKGKVVRTLINPGKAMLPGKYRLIWDAKDDRGFEVPSGRYFYRFSAPGYKKARQMLLVK